MEEEFEQVCDFNICEEEKEKGLEKYKAVFYSQSILEIDSPKQNNWAFCDQINAEVNRIMEQRKEEFNSSSDYDYSLELVIAYQISDKTSGHDSGRMEHKIEKVSTDKEEFTRNIEQICLSLDTTFKEHLVIMYNYQIFTIQLTCNFFVK